MLNLYIVIYKYMDQSSIARKLQQVLLISKRTGSITTN